MLIYASVMFTFLSLVRRSVPDRTALLERLAPAPEVVVDSLLARFTETPRGSTTCVAYCLHVISAHMGMQGPDDKRQRNELPNSPIRPLFEG